MAGGSRDRSRSSKTPWTHYLCIPLANASSKPQLERFLNDLKERLPSLPEVFIGHEQVRADEHLFEGALRSVDVIHFDLGALNLPTEQRVREATEFLEKLDLNHILSLTESERCRPGDGNRFVVDLEVPETMDNPGSTSKLCLKPDTSDELLDFCNDVRSKFIGNDFMISENREFDLHATVMDTRTTRLGKAAKIRGGARKQKGGKLTMDIQPLLDWYKQEWTTIWDVHLEKLAICKRKGKKVFNVEGEVVGKELDEVASIPLHSDDPEDWMLA